MKLLFEEGGIYSGTENTEWRIFKDVHYYCVMTTPGGGRNGLDARFVSLCSTLNINQPSDKIKYYIFQSILRGHLYNFPTNLRNISDTLMKITLKLFKV